MSTEQGTHPGAQGSRDRQARARRFAALGEPVRLGMVEHLALADASPGELATAFDLPTNLAAHHLRVLSEAGLIRKVRSEGDRRRTYLRLVTDDPVIDVVVRGTSLPAPVPRVVFVCTQNSARSQLAAVAWPHRSSIPATCAGTRPADRVHPRAQATARRHDLDLDDARTAHLQDVLRPGDLVVFVCDNAHEDLTRLPDDAPPRLHWAIPDPARLDTDEAFETAYRQLTERQDLLAAAVTPQR